MWSFMARINKMGLEMFVYVLKKPILLYITFPSIPLIISSLRISLIITALDAQCATIENVSNSNYHSIGCTEHSSNYRHHFTNHFRCTVTRCCLSGCWLPMVVIAMISSLLPQMASFIYTIVVCSYIS